MEKETKNKSTEKWFWVIAVVVSLTIAFLFALNKRYVVMNGHVVFDSWKKEMIKYDAKSKKLITIEMQK